MGVKNEHSEYTILKPLWSKGRAFMESETAIKLKGETYLPRLTEQDDDEYAAYKARTSVSMLAQSSKKSMIGMITRKESYIHGSENIEDLLDSIDSSGNSFEIYVSKLLNDFFVTGRGATLIDVPNVGSGITIAKAEELGIRPRFGYYAAEDIINWRTKKINNLEVLVMVVLREQVTSTESDDEFSWDDAYEYRVLDLQDDTTYRQRVFDESETQVGEDIIPKMNNKPLNYIPIVIHGGVSAHTPPLDQIVDINLHHYQLSADQIHGVRLTALPTPYLIGMDPGDDHFPTHIGPGRMIGVGNSDVTLGYLEFEGAGLIAVAALKEVYEQTIAMISVQMATEQINKSATGSAIDYSNSTASLAGMVDFLSAELTKALQIATEWYGKDPSLIKCELNKDFAPVSMTPALLAELFKQYIGGGISYATYYKNLAQGEITDPHKDPEEELREIEESMPPGFVADPMDSVEGDE